MAWGIIISFATLFGTLVLVMADAMEGEEADSPSFDEAVEGEEETVRKAA